MRAMAAQVGATAALASLTSIAGLQKGTSVLHHTFVSSLSDTSLKPAEHPSSLSPLILEKSSKFGSPVRPAAMPPAATGPRLTPKPFSREKSSDAFAVVKPPVTALKPSSVAPKSPTFAKTFGDATTPKGLTGNIPPLVDQKSIENRSTKDFVANMPFYSSPLANTVILFNTGNTEKAGMKPAAEKTYSTLQAQEGPVPSAVSEAPFRRPESAGIQRQSSLSSEPRPVSWNLHRSLEVKDTFAGTTEERTKHVEKDLRNGSSNLVSEVQPRPKQRPVSAIFLESVKDTKQSTPDVPDEKSLPEKSWVRKPRPLSVDLTAKFENRDLSAQRKSCPPESKERPLTAHLADTLGSRPSEMEAKSEVAESSTAEAPRSYLKSTFPVADSQSAKSDASTHIQTPSPNEAAPLGWNTPKDAGQVSAKDRKFLWELRLKGQDEDNDAEADSAGVSEKSKGLPTSKAWCVQEKAALSQRDACTGSKDAANTSDPENKFSRGGSVKKPLNFLGTLTNGVAPGNADSRPESPGKEKKSMNIQQRIKELTTENADGKPGHCRRSYASRPLSADLTKLFSSSVTAAEMKSEKKTEFNRMPLRDMQEVHENEPQLLRGADSSETRAAGSPQKLQQLSRATRAGGPLEREGSLLKGREPVAPQGESPASVASHDVKAYSTPPTAEKAAGIKTVRATIFEHSVQRHSIGLSGAELTSQPWKETVGRPLGHRKEPWLEGESDAHVTSKKVPFRQGDLSPDADKPWKRDSSNEEKALKAAATCETFTAKGKYEKHTSKQVEDSLMYQRIEPRYEILQTVGDRVQSEAVTAIPEKEAVPLRSRRSLRRRTEGSATDAAWPRSLDSKSGNRAKDGFVPEPKAVGEAAGKTASLEELYGSSSQHAFLRQVPKLDKAQTGQQQATVKPPYLQSRNKNSEIVDDKGSKQPSEAEREKREAVLAGKFDSSRILKHFPENLAVAPGRTDGCEAGVSTGQDAAVSMASEPKSRPSPCGASQWHKFSNRTSPPGADPARPYEQEGAKAFGLKAFPAAYVAHKELSISDCRAEGDQLQRPDAEGWGRRSGRAVSGTKASERWRRKTLPHDAIRFEEATEPARESAKSLSRRDSLQLHNDFAAKRSLRLRDGAEPRAGSFWGSGSSPNSRLQNELCPLAPRATYFAVTCQIPDECENAPENVLEPTRSRRISALEEDASAVHSEPPLRPEAKPACFRHLHQESERVGEMERGGHGPGVPRDKAADLYRSRVLDIDALMAEYKEDAKKASLIQGKREDRVSEDSCLASRERLTYNRTSTEKLPCEVNQRDSKKLYPSPGSNRHEVRAAEKPESCDLGRAPLRSRDSAFSPPPWGRLAVEQPQHVPAEPGSSRKKTFIIDEGEGESLVLKHQTEKRARSNAHVSSPGCVAVEPEASAAPPVSPSQSHVDGAPWKGTSPRQREATWTWDGWCSAPNLSEVQKRRASVHRSALDPGPCTAESGTERSAAVPGSANALPEWRNLYSEKIHQAGARDTLPSGLEAKERQGQSRDLPAVPPESAESWRGKWSTSQHHRLLQEGKKDRLRQCFGKPAAEAQDTDTLVQEADSQYGTWSDQRHSGDSLVPESSSPESSAAPTRRQPSSSRLSSFSSQTDPASGADQQDSSRDQRSTSLDCSSTDADSADGVHAPAGTSMDFSFLDQTAVLDSSALKTRVQLSKRRRQHRAPISHALRRSSGPDDKQRLHVTEEEVDSAWMFRDCTGEKLCKREESDEEDGPRSTERSPACQLQRRPVFPGMDHSALKAQLRKRQDPEGTAGGHSTPLPKSPRSPLPAGGLSGGRVLLPGTEKEERSEESSPQWLKELKSKKRQSQYENQV